MLWFDIISSDLNSIILYYINDPIKIYNLYNQNIEIFNNILDNIQFWINRCQSKFPRLNIKYIPLNFRGDIKIKIFNG